MSMRIGVDNLVIDSDMEVQLLNGSAVVEGDIIDTRIPRNAVSRLPALFHKIEVNL